jgi:RNA polymerase sigma-70 factor (ECF subfamily)
MRQFSFDELFERYHQEVYRLCIGMLSDLEEAEDATQEIFLRAYNAWNRYDPEKAAARTWLGHIAINYCRSILRRKRLYNLIQPFLPGLGAKADNHALNQELKVDLLRALDSLDEIHRSVVLLRYYLDLPCADIAAILGLSEGTVYSRLHTARQRLQLQLREEV